MVTVKGNGKRRTRQPRSHRSALYIAPSEAEYRVQIVKLDYADGTAQVIYEWSPGRFLRTYISVSDLDLGAVR